MYNGQTKSNKRIDANKEITRSGAQLDAVIIITLKDCPDHPVALGTSQAGRWALCLHYMML